MAPRATPACAAAPLGHTAVRRGSPTRLSAAAEAEIEALRRRRLSGPAIAREFDLPVSSFSVALRRFGLGQLAALDPPRHVIRSERERLGGLIHIDIKKLVRIEGIGHRITMSPSITPRASPTPR